MACAGAPGGARASARRRSAAYSPSTSWSGCVEEVVADGVRARGRWPRGRGARSASTRVPSPAPTSSTGPGRGDRVDPGGEQPAGAAEDGVGGEVEATLGLRSVPLAVGLGQLLGRGRRVGGGGAAARAARPAGEVDGAIVEGEAAPGTAERRPGLGIRSARCSQIAQTSSASSRSVSRSSKSPTSMASARGSGLSRLRREHGVVEPLLDADRHQATQAQRVLGEQCGRAWLAPRSRSPCSAADPNSPTTRTRSKCWRQSASSSAWSNSRKWYGSMISSGRAEREPVRRDEQRGAPGPEHPGHLGHDPFGIGDVLEGLHREDGRRSRPSSKGSSRMSASTVLRSWPRRAPA